MGPGTRDTGHEGHRAQVTVGTRDTGHEPRFGGVGVPALAGVILPLSWLFHPPPPPGPWDTGVLPWRGGRTPGSRAGGGHRGQERGPRSVGGSPGWGDTGGAWGGLGPSGGVGEGGAEAWAIPWGGRGVPGRSGVPGGGSPIPAPPPRHRLQPFRFRFSHPAGPGSAWHPMTPGALRAVIGGWEAASPIAGRGEAGRGRSWSWGPFPWPPMRIRSPSPPREDSLFPPRVSLPPPWQHLGRRPQQSWPLRLHQRPLRLRQNRGGGGWGGGSSLRACAKSAAKVRAKRAEARRPRGVELCACAAGSARPPLDKRPGDPVGALFLSRSSRHVSAARPGIPRAWRGGNRAGGGDPGGGWWCCEASWGRDLRMGRL